jgi:hypothetical protein
MLGASHCGIDLPETAFQCAASTDCPRGQLCHTDVGMCFAESIDGGVVDDVSNGGGGAGGMRATLAGTGGMPSAGKGAAGKGAAGTTGGGGGAGGVRAAHGGASGAQTAGKAAAGARAAGSGGNGAGGGTGGRAAAVAGAPSPAHSGVGGGPQAGGAGAPTAPPTPVAGHAPPAPSCPDGQLDCNHDLAAGTAGDGCETHSTDDVEHCGACDMRCGAPAGGIAACDASECMQYRLQAGDVKVAGVEHSPVGGGDTDYDARCVGDQVLIGLDVITDPSRAVMYGFKLACASVGLARDTSGAPVVVRGAPQKSDVIGYNPNPEPAAWISLDCGPNAMVTEVQGVFGGVTVGGGMFTTITQLVLTCSTAALGSQAQLAWTGRGALFTAAAEHRSSDYAFTDTCAGQAVIGFRGKYAGAIDKLQTQCRSLNVAYEAGMTQ